MNVNDETDQIFRKILDFDKICYKHCIKTVESKLYPKEEICLKNCTVKMINGISFLQKIEKDYQKSKSDIRRPQF